MPRWSADGSFFYFYQALPKYSFRKIPATGGADTEVAAGWSWETHNAAQEDPSGRLLVYTLLGHNKGVANMVRDLSTGQEKRLAGLLYNPRWSPDGSAVVGQDEKQQLATCPVSGGACGTRAGRRSISCAGARQWDILSICGHWI